MASSTSMRGAPDASVTPEHRCIGAFAFDCAVADPSRGVCRDRVCVSLKRAGGGSCLRQRAAVLAAGRSEPYVQGIADVDAVARQGLRGAAAARTDCALQ